MLTALVVIGSSLAMAGLLGLGWCLIRAMRVQGGKLPPEAARKAMATLRAVNMAAVATAFLGLAMVAVAAILA